MDAVCFCVGDSSDDRPIVGAERTRTKEEAEGFDGLRNARSEEQSGYNCGYQASRGRTSSCLINNLTLESLVS